MAVNFLIKFLLTYLADYEKHYTTGDYEASLSSKLVYL